MKRIFLIFVILNIANKLSCQNIGFTDTYPLNKLGSNPALASYDNKARFAVIGQYGKANEQGSLKNYYVSMELPVFENNGISLQYSDYSNMLIKNNSFALGLARHFKIGDNSIFSIGLNGGVSNTRYDYSSDFGISYVKEADKLSSGTSILPNTSKGPKALNQFNENQYFLGGGLYLNADKWHLGFAIPNLIKNKLPDSQDPKINYKLERPAFFSLEKDFNLNEKLKLTAGGLYRLSKNPFQKGLDLQSSIWLKKKYSLGLWYQRIGAKSSDQKRPLLAIAEIIINKARLAYSFNLIDNAANYTNIKQQIMLRIDIDYLKKKAL